MLLDYAKKKKKEKEIFDWEDTPNGKVKGYSYYNISFINIY